MNDETAWVIEFPAEAGRVRYYGRTIEGLGITEEPLDALRLARKVDAEMLIADVGWTEATPAEHLWIDELPNR